LMHRKIILTISALTSIALAACTPRSAAGPEPNAEGVDPVTVPVFPLARGPNQARYLVDQNGQPFFIAGDTAWSLIAQPDSDGAPLYLDDRHAKGVNAIVVNLIEHLYADHAPANNAGDAPFTGRPSATPNEAYFAHADAIIDAAAERHIAVLLAPLY